MPTAEPTYRELAELVELARAGSTKRIRVAVDGRDGAGKTTFANRLAAVLSAMGYEVYRAGIDGWHLPAEVRYRRGRESAEGYYLDAFDFEGVKRELLDPFASEGSGHCRLAKYDFVNERAVEGERIIAGDAALLVFDGVFLLRPEVMTSWELSIYLSVEPAVALKRAVDRDAASTDEEEIVRHLYAKRYLPGHELYEEAVSPARLADVVVDNTDPRSPVIVRR